MMFRRGFYVGALLGIGGTLTAGYLAIRTLVWVGGESIAEFGAKLHAAERRYTIEASPVMGQYTREQLSEPTPEEVQAIQRGRAAKKPKKKA